MIVRDQPPELSPEDEADLVAFVDGRLDPEGRARVEARAARDPAYKSALLHQQVGRDAVTAAAEATGAPLALKTRVEELGAARGRHKGEQAIDGADAARGPALARRRPRRRCDRRGAGRRRPRRRRPGRSRTSPPRPCARRPPRSRRWRRGRRSSRSAWPTSASRTTSASSAGRPSAPARTRSRAAPPAPSSTRRTARRIAYTVVSGAALEDPDAASRATVEGVGPALAARQGPRRRHLAPPRPHLRALLQGRPARGAADARRLEGHGRASRSRRRRRRPRARAPRGRSSARAGRCGARARSGVRRVQVPSWSSSQALVSSAKQRSSVSSRSSRSASSRDRREQLDARVEVARHQVGGADVDRAGRRRARRRRSASARGSARRSRRRGCSPTRPGTPGRRQQIPRMLRSTGTPACEAS